MSTIALVFDFDDTLAHDSTSAFLESMGVDSRWFWAELVQPLDRGGWDPIPAYLYALIRLKDHNPAWRITREQLRNFAGNLKFHAGVTRIFPFLKNHLKEKAAGLEIEFYIISSGIGEIIRNTRISKYFTDIWASEFHYDTDDSILFPRNVISFTDKTRYLFQISKGITGEEARADHYAVNRRISGSGYRIRMENMVFVGDGLTDIPCFSLIRRYHGITIGVYDKNKRERWSRAWDFLEEGRVTTLLSADYSIDSDLTRTLMMAIDRIASRITEI